MTAAVPTPSDHDQEHTARRAADRTFAALNPDFEVHHDAGDVTRRAMTQLTENLLTSGLEVHLAELRENDQELDEERIAVISQRAGLARERAAEDAFTTLNPDFGVVVDRNDPNQQHFAQQREAALALGTRTAGAAIQEQHPDRQQRQAAITARARPSAPQGRGDRLRQARHDRPPSAAAQRRAERPQRRSSDRRPRAEREEEERSR
jgi:hypothetical protein